MSSSFWLRTFDRHRSLHAPDRRASSRSNDPAHRRVLQLLAVPSAPQKQCATRELTDVQHVPGEEKAIPEDWREDVGVFSRAHRAEEYHIGVLAEMLREIERRSLEKTPGR